MRFREFNVLLESAGPLAVSSSSDDIAKLQKVLTAFDYNIGPDGVDGKLNPFTSAALGLAQRDIGLPATGTPDAATIDKLNTALKAEPEIASFIMTGPVSPTAGPNGIPSLNDLAKPTASSSHPQSIMLNRKAGNITTKDPAFNNKVAEVANTLQIDPQVLMRIMKHESGLRPGIVNGIGATGLIQFMPKTAAKLGTSTAALARMSAVEQMDWVLKYYQMVGVRPGMDVGDIYMLTFMPAYGHAGNNEVLGQLGGGILPKTQLSKDKIYRQNSIFDHSNKKFFTVGDVKSHINNYA